MSIPGANLLSMAGRLIKFQQMAHSRWKAMTQNNAGIDQATFYTPVMIQGSVQPIARLMYEQLGLDLQRDYLTVYTSAVLHDLRRDKTPDLLDFNGRRWSVESNTDWKNQDGWMASIVVDIGPSP